MKSVFRYIFILFVLLSSASCLIKNDMSYPRVDADIISFEVEGQVSSSIDPKSKTVSIVLQETADISKLRVKKYQLSEGAEIIDSFSVGDNIDLSKDLTVILKVYTETVWTITAVQPIERYVKCENEAEPAHINEYDKSVTVFVNEHQSLESVVIKEMKLEPEGSEITSTYRVKNGEIIDRHDVVFPMSPLYCVFQRIFTVEYQGEEILWTFNVVQIKIDMKVNSVIPWCNSAEVSAVYSGTGDPYIQYRKTSEENWTDISQITFDGNNISCRIERLDEGTEYAVRAANGSDRSAEQLFTTGTPDQIDNMDFDKWYQEGKVWYPNPGPTIKIWDTANKGASLLGDSSTIPVDFVAVQGADKQAARLESRWAAIAFAAGNIYSGEFGRVNGIGAELQWGTSFTGRPKALHGYYAYEPKVIDRAKPPYESLKGQMDQCQILVLLTDWDEPFKVNTTTGTFVDQENDPHIIAYAKYESSENTGGQYREFTLPLEYRRPDATPKYAVIVACASYKGDFFTGGTGSLMYVDEFSFIYE
mgnify:FL=1